MTELKRFEQKLQKNVELEDASRGSRNSSPQ
jgi:hypothetical protein